MLLDYRSAVKGRRGAADNSPSFDRLDPNKGYVPGNVYIISARANVIKSDASANELRAIADWLDVAMKAKP